MQHFVDGFNNRFNLDRIAEEMRGTRTPRWEAIDAEEADDISVEGTVEARGEPADVSAADLMKVRGTPDQRFLYLLKGMRRSIQIDLDASLVREVQDGHTVDYVKANSHEGAVLRAKGPVYLTPCGQLTLLARTIGLVEAKDEKSAVKPQNWRVRRDIKRK